MKSFKFAATMTMLGILLVILSVSCSPPPPTSEAGTPNPTPPTSEAGTLNPPPPGSEADTPDPNITLTLTPAASLGWPGVQGNTGHTGEAEQEFPIALEPKWVAQPSPAWSDQMSAIVADDEMVVVGDVPIYLSGAETISAYQDWRGTPPKGGQDPAGYGLYAFRLADGVQKWHYATGGLLVGAPQIVSGNVYAVTWQTPASEDEEQTSIIYCLNGEDGTLVWKYTIPDAYVGALSVADGVVVIPGSGVELKKVFGLEASSGRPLWTASLEDELSSPPFRLFAPAIADDRVYLVSHSVFALDLQTGELVWRSNHERYTPNFLEISLGNGPIVAADGRLFLSDIYNVYALDANNGQIVWQSAAQYTNGNGMSYDHDQKMMFLFSGRFLIAMDGNDGTELWRKDLEGSEGPAAILGNNNRILTEHLILDQSNGETIWSAYETDKAWPWGRFYPNALGALSLEDWLPNEYVVNADGISALLPGFEKWTEVPAVSGGLVIGWVQGWQGREVQPQNTDTPYSKDLVAFGADTTPPDVRFNPGPWDGRMYSLKGTAYDYNLDEWTLELRGDQPQATWQVLASENFSIQDKNLNNFFNLDTKKLADGVWTMRLTASDTAGLTSSDETTFIIDTTPPVVEITQPEDGERITEHRFTLEGTASDLNGIAQVRISSDNGRTFTLASGTTQWTFPVTVTTAMEGKSMTFIAEATDNFGNRARSNKVTLTFPKLQVALQAGGRRLVGNYSLFTEKGGENDIDGDGIDQGWENEIIRLTMPIIELDENEEWLDQYPHHMGREAMVLFVRVTGYTPDVITNSPEIGAESKTHPAYILVYIAFGWPKDYGGFGLGVTNILLEAHRGDSENIVMAWRVTDDSGKTAELEWVRTSAHGSVNRHHGLWNAWQNTCTLANVALNAHTTSYTQKMCANLKFLDDGRLLLYASEDKHALYPSTEVCNEAELWAGGYKENCGWDPTVIFGVSQNPEDYYTRDPRYQGYGRWLFEAYNVGEPDPEHKYQLIDFLDQPRTWRGLTAAQESALTGLYPNEAVWSGEEFCGGLGTFLEIDTCSTKLGKQLGQAEDGESKGPPDLLSTVLEARYEVSIKTGDRDLAGTDAIITIQLNHNGQMGETSKVYSSGDIIFIHDTYDPIRAPYPYVGSFERGSMDHIYLYQVPNDAKEIPGNTLPGEITGITLSQDGTGGGPGWFVEQVVVRDLLTQKAWVARIQRWLSADYSTRAYIPLTPYQPVLYDTIEYQVIVDTGNNQNAGTDGGVFIKLAGADGSVSNKYKLDDPDKNDFERGSQGSYIMKSPDLGQLTALIVYLEKTEADADWYCQEVTVRNLMTGQVWVFPVNTWLGEGSNGPLTVEVNPID
jgi:outer membrane protein assembly factor BamB